MSSDQNQQLISDAEEFVRQLMENEFSPGITFHNSSLLSRELASLDELLDAEKLAAEEEKVLRLALIFRLTGFRDSYDDHLPASLVIGKTYLESQEVTDEEIKQVLHLISTSRTGYQPENRVEELFQDVQMAFYGQKKFRSRLEDMLDEKNRLSESSINLKNWYDIHRVYLRKHNYHTETARKLYGKRKKKNRKKINKAQDKLADFKKETSFSTDSTARTIFKVSLRNHIDLTNIGDQKANIMLSVNAIILTIGIPIYVRYASEYKYLTIPAFIFMATCVVTMIFAAYATKPSGMRGEIDMEELNAGKTDIFFFGNFYGIKQETYQKLVRLVLSDRKLMDDGLINHLYFMGDSLGKKYIYLRICYSVFIGGIMLTVLAFILSYSIMGA